MEETTETALMVAPQQGQGMAQVTVERLRAVRAIIAPNLTEVELMVFAEVCNQLGLNPFLRQIHAIKRGDKATFQTGIDGYRLLAARTRQLAGIDDVAYDVDDADHPNRASVTVYRYLRGQRVAFTATARWREYAVDNGPMWRKMPYLMLGKCAEALALRRAFPAELSGVYTDEEMQQADNAPVVEAAAVTPAETRTAPQTRPTAPQQSAVQPVQPATRRSTDTDQHQAPVRSWSALHVRALALGYDTQEAWERLVTSATGKTANWTVGDLKALDKHLAEQEALEAAAVDTEAEIATA